MIVTTLWEAIHTTHYPRTFDRGYWILGGPRGCQAVLAA